MEMFNKKELDKRIDQIKKSYDVTATKAGGQTITLSAVGDISPSKYRKFSSV